MKETKMTAKTHAKLGTPYMTFARGSEVMYAYHAKEGPAIYVHTTKNRVLVFDNMKEFASFMQSSYKK